MENTKSIRCFFSPRSSYLVPHSIFYCILVICLSSAFASKEHEVPGATPVTFTIVEVNQIPAEGNQVDVTFHDHVDYQEGNLIDIGVNQPSAAHEVIENEKDDTVATDSELMFDGVNSKEANKVEGNRPSAEGNQVDATFYEYLDHQEGNFTVEVNQPFVAHEVIENKGDNVAADDELEASSTDNEEEDEVNPKLDHPSPLESLPRDAFEVIYLLLYGFDRSMLRMSSRALRQNVVNLEYIFNPPLQNGNDLHFLQTRGSWHFGTRQIHRRSLLTHYIFRVTYEGMSDGNLPLPLSLPTLQISPGFAYGRADWDTTIEVDSNGLPSVVSIIMTSRAPWGTSTLVCVSNINGEQWDKDLLEE